MDEKHEKIVKKVNDELEKHKNDLIEIFECRSEAVKKRFELLEFLPSGLVELYLETDGNLRAERIKIDKSYECIEVKTYYGNEIFRHNQLKLDKGEYDLVLIAIPRKDK